MLNALSQPLNEALSPLFERLAITEAMPRLVEPSNTSNSPFTPLVQQIIDETLVGKYPTLVAGIWLYVDELDRSHHISQDLDHSTGSYWHGIMHRREGDFSNSHYWFRRAGSHPAMSLVADHYDPDTFVDQVAAANRNKPWPQELVELQRREWATLLTWCADDQGI